MTGTKPNLFNMHTFGTVCYAYVQNKTKLDPRAEKGIFVGYDRSSPAFLVNYPDQNNVKKIRPVKFAEKFDSVDENVDLLPDSVEATEPEMSKPENGPESIRRYTTRDLAKPKYLDDYITGEEPANAVDDAANCTVVFCYRVSNVRESYQDAISFPESGKWRDAKNEELDALWDNETF